MDINIFDSIRNEYAQKRRRAQEIADERRAEIYAKLSEIKNYDAEMLMLARTLVGAKDTAEAKLARIEELTLKRAEALNNAGYPADYTNPPYSCTKCNDTGYEGTSMCSCMKQRIRLESIKACGLGKLAETQSFDNFSLSFYDPSEKERASINFKALKEFAERFDKDTYENFLLVGGTGLGKTHLSTSVAKTVIEKGYDVVYTTTIRMLDCFEKKRFGGAEFRNMTDKFFDCDLLIIDDLGCEMSTQFTVSALYDLINTRLNDGKCTIINTNLTAKELRDKYDDRITSRILGNYRALLFAGQDIRIKKLFP